MSFCRNVRLYMGKNLREKSRHPCATALELLCPIILIWIIILVFLVLDVEEKGNRAYDTSLMSPDMAPLAALPAQLRAANHYLAMAPRGPELDAVIAALDAMYPAVDLLPAFDAAALTALGYNVAELDWTIPSFSSVIRRFSSDEAIDAHIDASEYEGNSAETGVEKLWAAVSFHSFGPHWDYSVRMNTTALPDLDTTDQNNENPFARGVNFKSMVAYMTPFQQPELVAEEMAPFNGKMPGFMALQLAIDRIIINQRSPQPTPPVKALSYLYQIGMNSGFFKPEHALIQQALAGAVNTSSPVTAGLLATFLGPLQLAPQSLEMGAFPTAAYSSHPFFAAAAGVFAFFFVLTMLLPVSRIIRGIVHEKETRIRERMMTMGLTTAALNLVWFITYGVMFAIVALLVVVSTNWSGGLFAHSSGFLLFALVFVFGMSCVFAGYMISAFFSRAKTASIVGMLFFCASFFPKFAITDTSSEGEALAASILSPVAFGLGMDIVAELEDGGVGLNFDTASLGLPHVNFVQCMYMMLLDCAIYAVLGWYFYEVLPSETGFRRPLWFPFTLAYWTGAVVEPPVTKHVRVKDTHMEEPSEYLKALEEAQKTIKISGVTKNYFTSSTTVTAVKNLDLTLYEGQCFCLLGHNGAGKTTLLSMLNGVTTPTSGSIMIKGERLVSTMGDVRKNLGWCPQDNTLFDDLTVREHLEFFAGLRGVVKDKVADVALAMARDVGLASKTEVLSRRLSGGQKRKLNVGIALIGDAKIVLLDEPTSGMDPYSRRATWNLLKNNRAGRIIVLTTHFMDEADALGDRIGILAHGELQCCGSAMFLKSRYGVGYSLTAVTKPGCDRTILDEIVARHVPDSMPKAEVGAEISFQLPLNTSSKFPQMLRELEDRLDEVQLQTFGISVTTMEDVFLKVAQHGDEGYAAAAAKTPSIAHHHTTPRPAHKHTSPGRRVVPSDTDGAGSAEVKVEVEPEATSKTPDVSAMRQRASRAMCFPHFVALLQKRLRYGMRDRKTQAFQLLIPVLAVLLGILLLEAASNPIAHSPNLSITTQAYNKRPDGTWLEHRIPFANTTVGSTVFAAVPTTTATLVPVSEANLLAVVPTVDFEDSGTPSSSVLRGMSAYLFNTRSAHEASRYGAYVLNGSWAAPGMYRVDAQVLLNTTAKHAAPLYANLLSDAVYRAANPGVDVSITVHNHPLHLTKSVLEWGSSFEAGLVSYLLILSFGFIPTAFIVFAVKEREIAAKHSQLLSGVSIFGYWSSNFAFDTISYLLPSALALGLLAIFDISELVGADAFAGTLLLLLAYGMASASFAYLCSFLFRSPSTAQNTILLLSVLSLLLNIVSFILQFFEDTQATDDSLRYIYRFFPGYCLGEGLLNLSWKTILKMWHGWDDDSVFAMHVLGKPLVYLLVEAVVYFATTVAVDYMLGMPNIRAMVMRDPVVARVKRLAAETDGDVLAEEARMRDAPLAENEAGSDVARLLRLRKVYGDKTVAVDDLSFGIRKGECFGFLGTNGAGKTTVLKMLTGEEVPSDGTATLLGFDILRDQRQVRQLLGYCPQFDALLELLTPREHLDLYARIKGIPAAEREHAVTSLLKELDLLAYESTVAANLSGGNKRKLSVGIAMISKPPLMLLDEPSTGLDPVARRFMWGVIAKMAKKTSVILVSHSMEECEALCNRIAIMVAGRLSCIGSVQHLKERFGQGFTAEVKLGVARLGSTDTLVAACGGNADAVITRDTLASRCSRLGDASRVELCTLDGPGWAIAAALDAHHGVSVREFVHWWLAESEAAALASFMADSFPGASLLERQATRLQFSIPMPDVEGMRVSDMFDTLERAKGRLNVEAYSLSQTTLEMVFNAMAKSADKAQLGYQGRLRAPSVGHVPVEAAAGSGSGSGAGDCDAGPAPCGSAAAAPSQRVASDRCAAGDIEMVSTEAKEEAAPGTASDPVKRGAAESDPAPDSRDVASSS